MNRDATLRAQRLPRSIVSFDTTDEETVKIVTDLEVARRQSH